MSGSRTTLAQRAAAQRRGWALPHTSHAVGEESEGDESGDEDMDEDEEGTQKDEVNTGNQQNPDDKNTLDSSTGAWQMELLQEAAELIVSEAGTHPGYRCLIIMQPHNFFKEWTEKIRDEVLDTLCDHVTVRV
mgnify:CR=1 FL=1